MMFISDDEKLAAEGSVRGELQRGGAAGRLQVRPSCAHLGVMWGQARERGLSVLQARDMITGIAENWADGGNARPGEVPVIGDEDILAGVNDPRVMSCIPDSDWGGLFDLGCQYGQRRQVGQSHAQALTETGAWLATYYRNPDGTPIENPWPPSRPAHPDPLVGQVALVDGAWCDATGPRNIAALHLGNLIGHGLIHGVDRVLPYLDLAASLGYHELRAWFQLHTDPGGWWDRWSTPRWNPMDHPTRFTEILAAGAQRGLRWHLAGGGIRGLDNAQENALFDTLNRAIREIGPEAFSLIEAANEVRDTGDADDQDPVELTRLVRRATAGFPQILTALSAYTGTEDREILHRYTPSWMNFYLIHGYRAGRAHDKIRHIFSGAYEGTPVRRNAKHGEPFGVGRLVSAQDNHHELDAHVMTLAAAMCAMSRGSWSFMSGPGVVLESEPLANMPGLSETPAILRALPQDIARFQTLGHGGPSHEGRRIYAARDDWRADYAIHQDGRYVCILYGPPEQHRPDDLQQRRATRNDRVLADGRWGRVLTGEVV